ncbi:MAG: GDSL-type esterase/lipase family protein [Lacipirellulaceae bacterium]
MIGLRILIVLTAALSTVDTLGQNIKLPTSCHSAVVPASKDWSEWTKLHRRFKQQSSTERPRLIFLGDSITQGWTKEGLKTWNHYYNPLAAANFGIAGDRTQHLLYRIQDGYFLENQPEVVVVLIGTNNIKEQRNTPPETVEGIEKVVEVLAKQLPKTRILLLGILPCGESPTSQQRQDTAAVNLSLSQKSFGETVRFLDLGQHFLQSEGMISKEIMPDFLHLSSKGYQLLAEKLEPRLQQLMSAK